MRRDVLLTALARVSRDLKETSLLTYVSKLFEELRRGGPSKDGARPPVTLAPVADYLVRSSSYGDAERSVLATFELSDLLSSKFWDVILNGHVDVDRILALRSSIRFAETHAPMLANLLKRDYVDDLKAQHGKSLPELKGRGVLTVLAMEDDLQFSSPTRIVLIFEAITALYAVFARLDGASETDLSVLACDSGSDKSFDFLGLAKLMEQLKECILAIWDRKVMYKQMEAGAAIALVAQSLPVIQRIDELKVAGALGPEEAELLKRKTIEGASKFLEAGASIPELDSLRPNPRALMRPEQKLLAGPGKHTGSAKSEQAETDLPGDEPSMSTDELDELERLVQKARRARPAKPSRKATKEE